MSKKKNIHVLVEEGKADFLQGVIIVVGSESGRDRLGSTPNTSRKKGFLAEEQGRGQWMEKYKEKTVKVSVIF